MSWLMVAGLGVGAAKSGMDAEKAERQRKVQAATTRYSPWTGMQGQAPEEANVAGNMLQGGMTGAGLAQNASALESQKALQGAQVNYLNSQAMVPGMQQGMQALPANQMGPPNPAVMNAPRMNYPTNYTGMKVWSPFVTAPRRMPYDPEGTY